MISLQVNGKKVKLDQPTPLLDYLERLGVNPRTVAVEHNGEIIPRTKYTRITFRDGDRVEIVRMVGGGGQPRSRIAASASARSSHGSDPRNVRIERS